ncbi:BREX-3 system P-loop-containing protein BrxF [Carnobacterium inhibens]|uniref:BREX-3 system P-loop-containing protein BrxF n=1 Tax=Carnobacterium inhibens TaxID=147709 RepID=UPI000692431E|nr:BREX-3 system P-loop-containing protein BrxF [Carnobacterium inhibens]
MITISEEILLELAEQLSSKYEKLAIIKMERNQNIPKLSQLAYLSVNLPLSKILININRRSWGSYSSEFITDAVQGVNNYAILIDYFELLMSPDLSLDIFDLFKQLSKNKVVIIIWRYPIEDNYLIYGKLGHSEYKKIELADVTVIQ